MVNIESLIMKINLVWLIEQALNPNIRITYKVCTR